VPLSAARQTHLRPGQVAALPTEAPQWMHHPSRCDPAATAIASISVTMCRLRAAYNI
jgi:hypothetical protein